jgi:hypothetical protein
MNTAELIYQKTKDLPEPEALEILDFVEFLRRKRGLGEPDEEHAATEEKAMSLEEHSALVERMRAITAIQPMTRTTVEDMRSEARY